MVRFDKPTISNKMLCKHELSSIRWPFVAPCARRRTKLSVLAMGDIIDIVWFGVSLVICLILHPTQATTRSSTMWPSTHPPHPCNNHQCEEDGLFPEVRHILLLLSYSYYNSYSCWFSYSYSCWWSYSYSYKAPAPTLIPAPTTPSTGYLQGPCEPTFCQCKMGQVSQLLSITRRRIYCNFVKSNITGFNTNLMTSTNVGLKHFTYTRFTPTGNPEQ